MPQRLPEDILRLHWIVDEHISVYVVQVPTVLHRQV
jgi:hypothetical protein